MKIVPVLAQRSLSPYILSRLINHVHNIAHLVLVSAEEIFHDIEFSHGKTKTEIQTACCVWYVSLPLRIRQHSSADEIFSIKNFLLTVAIFRMHKCFDSGVWTKKQSTHEKVCCARKDFSTHNRCAKEKDKYKYCFLARSY